mgnify:CR=1 FL=1
MTMKKILILGGYGLTGKPLQPEPVRFSVLHQAGRQGQRLQNIFSRVSVNAFHDDFYRVGCRSDGNKPGSGKQAEKKESAAKCSHGWRRCRGCRIGKGHDPDRFFKVAFAAIDFSFSIPLSASPFSDPEHCRQPLLPADRLALPALCTYRQRWFCRVATSISGFRTAHCFL